MFPEKKMDISSISSDPQGYSHSIHLWGMTSGGNGTEQIIAVNFDFRGLSERKCELGSDGLVDTNGDYELWLLIRAADSVPSQETDFELFQWQTDTEYCTCSSKL